jgi:DNA mismatch repair protein MutS2
MQAAEPGFVPDLLHPTPLHRIDAERTKLALTLAFSGGVSGPFFNEALDAASFAPSTFQPSTFVNDLFLPRFVAQCFKIRVGQHDATLATGHLVRLLAQPPADPAIVAYRRGIVYELASSPALRAELEGLYASLCRLRGLLENAGAGRNWDPGRRQLDVLQVAKDAFERMDRGFAQARSGLASLHDFGARVVAGESFRALADLLRYDAQLATLSLKVAVGADGRIRGFEIVQISENRENQFTNPAWKRWLGKMELFLRGYRFGDGEVMARLVDTVFGGLEDDLVALVQLVGDLEFYLGALGFADHAKKVGLSVCLPELVAPDAPRALHGLFNPLLLMSGITPVPCDLVSDRLASTVLVTGPNSGGKTRLLQAVGLSQLLAQSGLFIPARSGQIALSPGLVVSLIQETKADQAEGRLGTELMRIRELFEHLPPGAMVLLDELCSGTNPSEGEEIFELVLRMLARLQPQAFITTHFLAFAARLARERTITDLEFLQVELGAERRPTYQFTRGVASSSLAGHTAERLGVTGEQLLLLVERNLQRTLESFRYAARGE